MRSLYCIVLLIFLFGSSCYWEPVPTAWLLQRNPHLLNTTDPFLIRHRLTVTPLTELVSNYTTWNQTTITDQVMPDGSIMANETIPITPSSRPSLPLTQLYERCWCDIVSSLLLSDILNPTFSRRKDRKPSGLAVVFPPSGFFDPFDQKGWESASLVRHARKISPPPPPTPASVETDEAPAEEPEPEKPVVDQLEGSAWRAKARLRNLLSPVHAFNKRVLARIQGKTDNSTTASSTEAPEREASSPGAQDVVAEKESVKETAPGIQPPIPFWWLWVKLWRTVVDFLGKKYDLEPYGVPVVVDFGWGRS